MMVLSCPLFGGFSGLEARLEDNNYWMSNIGGGGGGDGATQLLCPCFRALKLVV